MEPYKIVAANNLDELARRVNEAIRSGYSPLGSMTAFYNESFGPQYQQAMLLRLWLK